MFVNVKAIVPILRNQCEQVWFQIEDTEAMLLQNQSGSSWLENPGEPVVCVSLCIQDRSKSNFKKELSNGRELILPLFNGAKPSAWTLVRDEAGWLHSEGVCVRLSM